MQLANRALVLALLGRCDEAAAVRARFTGIESDQDETAFDILTLIFEMSIHCKDFATAESLLRRLSVLADRLETWSMVSFGRLLGRAAVMLGRTEDALGFYRQALEACNRVGFGRASAHATGGGRTPHG